MADQPAQGPDGQLPDTSKIQWYNDPDNAHPIQQAAQFHRFIDYGLEVCLSCRSLTAGTRLATAIAAEKLDEFGNPTQSYHQHPVQTHNSHATTKCK
jgi:hypothetical protein